MEDRSYPIRAVSRLTGLSIETLRAWERRYNVVTPQREGGRRLYTEDDVERFRLLSAAAERGHTISRLAGMGDEELRQIIAEPPGVPRRSRKQALKLPAVSGSATERILDAIGRLDYAAAERELGLLATLLPPRELVFTVALPLMREIGEAWHAGTLSVAQEHMGSSLLRNLVGALMPLHRRMSSPGKVLFATPSGEHHETGILLCAMLAAGAGLSIVYLGADLPADEIVVAARETSSQVVVMGFVGANGAGAAIGEVKRVAEQLPPEIELWVGGTKDTYLVDQIRETRALFLTDFAILEQHLARLGTQA
jgi:DNA-binding transcriptional MerR regulator/methylmalonyl-CoA mutase cobalamin-binding subunit